MFSRFPSVRSSVVQLMEHRNSDPKRSNQGYQHPEFGVPYEEHAAEENDSRYELRNDESTHAHDDRTYRKVRSKHRQSIPHAPPQKPSLGASIRQRASDAPTSLVIPATTKPPATTPAAMAVAAASRMAVAGPYPPGRTRSDRGGSTRTAGTIFGETLRPLDDGTMMPSGN